MPYPFLIVKQSCIRERRTQQKCNRYLLCASPACECGGFQSIGLRRFWLAAGWTPRDVFSGQGGGRRPISSHFQYVVFLRHNDKYRSPLPICIHLGIEQNVFIDNIIFFSSIRRSSVKRRWWFGQTVLNKQTVPATSYVPVVRREGQICDDHLTVYYGHTVFRGRQ